MAGCSNAVLGLPLEMSAVNTSGARAASTVPCAAAYRAVPAERAMILAHMVMNKWGKCKTKGSRHGAKAKGRQARHGKARQDKAVVAKRAGGEADRHRPCSKNSRQVD